MKFTLIEDVGKRDFYMEFYIAQVKRDYFHGWDDSERNRSNLCVSEAYKQGYKDCQYEMSLK